MSDIIKANIEALDTIANRCAAIQTIEQKFERAVAIADAMEGLSVALTDDVMQRLMKLQGRAIGFRTDKDSSGGYKATEVKDAIVESILRGLYPVGNEFNIIAGRCYVTKEGYARLLREMPGLAYTKIVPGIPRMTQGGAVVGVSLDWEYNGVKGAESLEFAIKVNNGMGADAIVGKATRKARAWLYGYLTDSEQPEGDASEINITADTTVADDSLRDTLPDPFAAVVASLKSPKHAIIEYCESQSVDWSNLPQKWREKITADPAAFDRAVSLYIDQQATDAPE